MNLPESERTFPGKLSNVTGKLETIFREGRWPKSSIRNAKVRFDHPGIPARILEVMMAICFSGERMDCNCMNAGFDRDEEYDKDEKDEAVFRINTIDD